LAVLGTMTLTTYQPFFSFPTLVHLAEAVMGFGYLSSFFKDKKRIIFLGLIVTILFSAHLFYQSQGSRFSPKEDAPEKNAPSTRQQEGAPSGKTVCGNDICEPGLGETKETCRKDCSAGD